jgi:hypothetical protein
MTKSKSYFLAKDDSQPLGPFSEAELWSMDHSGAIDRYNLIWTDGASGWRPLKDVLPHTPHIVVGPKAPNIAQPSFIKAGWICLGVGVLTSWCFIGFPVMSVAGLLAIIAICKNDLTRGLILLLSTLAIVLLCSIIVPFVLLGAMFHVVHPMLPSFPPIP